jgi:hypothetical protein
VRGGNTRRECIPFTCGGPRSTTSPSDSRSTEPPCPSISIVRESSDVGRAWTTAGGSCHAALRKKAGQWPGSGVTCASTAGPSGWRSVLGVSRMRDAQGAGPIGRIPILNGSGVNASRLQPSTSHRRVYVNLSPSSSLSVAFDRLGLPRLLRKASGPMYRQQPRVWPLWRHECLPGNSPINRGAGLVSDVRFAKIERCIASLFRSGDDQPEESEQPLLVLRHRPSVLRAIGRWQTPGTVQDFCRPHATLRRLDRRGRGTSAGESARKGSRA